MSDAGAGIGVTEEMGQPKRRLRRGALFLAVAVFFGASFLAAPYFSARWLPYYPSFWVKTTRYSAGGWAYEESVPRFSWTVAASRLTFEGKPLPARRVPKDALLFTPVGNFRPLEDEWRWTGGNVRLPPSSSVGHWAAMTISGGPISVSAGDMQQGYYETSNRDWGRPPDVPWVDVQIQGTPYDWAYVFRQDGAGYRGYWVAPAKLGDLPWK